MPKSSTIESGGEGSSPQSSSDAAKPQRKVRARRNRALTPAPPPPGQALPPETPMTLALPGARETALRRLGLDKIPYRVNLTAVLAPAGGIARLMDEIVPLLSSVDQRYHRLLDLWTTTNSSDKAVLFPEDYLFMADIAPADFIGEVARISFRLSVDAGVLMAADAHLDIVKTSLEAAKLPVGVKDREWHLKAAGYIPLPKGANILIQNNASPQGQGSQPGGGATALPIFENRARTVSDAMEAEDAEFEDVPEKEDQ